MNRLKSFVYSIKIFFLFLFLHTFLSFSTFSQIYSKTSTTNNTIYIKGIAPGAAGKIIKVAVFSDQINYSEKIIASSSIDSGGKFCISINIEKTTMAFLKIDLCKSRIFLQPKTNYEIKFDAFDYTNPDDKNNSFIDPPELTYLFANPNEILNTAIRDFDALYYDFFFKNIAFIKRFKNKTRLDTFKLEITKKFANVKDEYFTNYIKYKCASIEDIANLESKYKIAIKYLVDKPVLFDNIEYMSFFNDYFKKYLISNSTKVTPFDLDFCINQNKSYTALLDSMGKDSILINEVLREAVMLEGLGELYKLKTFDKKNIIFMLNDISKRTKFLEISTIANNLVSNLTKLETGSIAPVFTLPDINNLKYSLNDFKGKYIYLNFFTTNNLPCISEFQLMNQLKIDYGKDIEIISISVDKEVLTLGYFLERKNFNWLFLHYNNDYDLLEKYNAKSYPLFILIDRNGKIILSQAPKPSENVKKYFEELTAPVVKEIKRQY